jgi:hypothetical protein
LVFVVCDLRMISRNLVDRAKELAAAALGWSADHMLVAATHTHAAPGLVNLQEGSIDRWYAEFVVLRIADAIRRAAAQLAPARIGWGSVCKPEHVFNRRWKVKPNGAPPNPFGDTGDLVVTNPTASQGVLEPAGIVDPEFSVLSVQHADGRPLAVLANYGLHYVGGYTPGSVSADYFAVFADRTGQLLGGEVGDAPFVGMLSNGASGDVNNVNRRQPPERSPPWQKMQTVAEDLAQSAARQHGPPAACGLEAVVEPALLLFTHHGTAWLERFGAVGLAAAATGRGQAVLARVEHVHCDQVADVTGELTNCGP